MTSTATEARTVVFEGDTSSAGEDLARAHATTPIEECS